MGRIVSSLWIGLLASGLSAGAVSAQAIPPQGTPQQDMPPQDATQNGGAGIRAGHIASTGKTMPNVGASKGAGTTPMDRGIQNEDTRIETSICKGC